VIHVVSRITYATLLRRINRNLAIIDDRRVHKLVGRNALYFCTNRHGDIVDYEVDLLRYGYDLGVLASHEEVYRGGSLPRTAAAA
jgi:hypothetical protein